MVWYQGYLEVGHLYLGSSSGVRRRSTMASALKFDLPSQVTGRTVTKATLRLYASEVRKDLTWVNPNGPTSSMTIQLRVSAFASNWDPASLSWNVWESLGTQGAGEAVATAPNTLKAVDFDVATIVRNWAAGTWPNFGMKLAADLYPDPGVDSYGITNFYSSVRYNTSDQRPQLIVEYQ